VLGVAVVGGGVAALVRSPAPEAPTLRPVSTLAEASTVELGVQVSPSGLSGLDVSIGGVPVTPQAPHRVVPRAAGPLVVKVSAPGYRSVELPVVPDRDRTMMVTLLQTAPVEPRATAEAAKPTSPRAPATAPSGVIHRYPF
jgi:hypothetical protein